MGWYLAESQDDWNEYDIVDFQEFLKREEIPANDERVPILKKAWDRAIKSASICFYYDEGTDYAVKESLTEP